MPSESHPHQQTVEKVLQLAAGVLSGEYPALPAAHELVPCLRTLGLLEDPRFSFLAVVESETEHLPILEADRKNWLPGSLVGKKPDLDRAELWCRDGVVEVCDALVSHLRSDGGGFA